MKILIFSHYYTPEGNAPATRISALARRWIRSGHEVTVITCAPNVPDGKIYPGYRNRIWPQTEWLDGVRVIRVWTHIAPNKGFVRRIANYLSYMVSAVSRALFLRAPDIIIATSPQFFCGWAGVLYAAILRCTRWFRGRRVPFVLEIRDIWPESIGAVEAMKSSLSMRILQWLEIMMYRQSDHIVTVGKGYQRQLMAKGVGAHDVSIVMNGVDKDILSADGVEPQTIREEYGLESYFVCSYIGTIGMACGLDVVLRAAQTLADRQDQRFKFLIVGDGATRAELQAQTTQLGLEHVIFTGRQPKQRISSFLAASDVSLVHLIKTPLFETVIPSKIFEALGMRRPIIVGVAGEARELIEQSGGGIAIEPENDTQLLAALEYLYDHPEQSAAMGTAGHDFVDSRFDRDHLALEYLEILKQCVQQLNASVAR